MSISWNWRIKVTWKLTLICSNILPPHWTATKNVTWLESMWRQWKASGSMFIFLDSTWKYVGLGLFWESSPAAATGTLVLQPKGLEQSQIAILDFPKNVTNEISSENGRGRNHGDWTVDHGTVGIKRWRRRAVALWKKVPHHVDSFSPAKLFWLDPDLNRNF